MGPVTRNGGLQHRDSAKEVMEQGISERRVHCRACGFARSSGPVFHIHRTILGQEVRIMIKRIIVSFTLVLLCASATSAGLGDPTMRAMRWDFTVQTRYIGEHTWTGEQGSSVAVNSDLGWGFGFGYNIDERFNVGFFFNWRSADYVATVVPEDTEEDNKTYGNWLETGVMAVCADWYILPKRITPYVTGAVGWAFLDTNIPADLYGACWYDPWYGYVCYSDIATYGQNAFSYSFGAGVRLEATEAVFFRVGYEYNGVSVDGAEGLNVLRIDGGITM